MVFVKLIEFILHSEFFFQSVSSFFNLYTTMEYEYKFQETD